MKYEVGDVVKIRDDLKCGKYYSIYFCDDMLQFNGEIVKINRINKAWEGYKIDKCEKTNRLWSDEMIERKATTKECIDNGYSDIEYGDRVRVLNPNYGWIEGILRRNKYADQMILDCDGENLGIVGIGDNDEIEKVIPQYKNCLIDNIVAEEWQGTLDDIKESENKKTEEVIQQSLHGIPWYQQQILGNKIDSTLMYARTPSKSYVNQEILKRYVMSTNNLTSAKKSGKSLVNQYYKEFCDLLYGNDENKNNKEEYDMVEEFEFIVRGKQASNGWTITVDDGSKKDEVRIGNDLSNTVGIAVDDVVRKLNRKELEKKAKRDRIKGLEEELSELKGE